MTAEERVRVRAFHYVKAGTAGDQLLDLQGVLDVLSTLDALRAANAEQRAVIERLTTMLHPQPLPCGHAAEHGHTSDGGATIRCCACEVEQLKSGADMAGLWNGDAAGVRQTLAVVRAAYGWTLDSDGRVLGLVAGDMGYADTSIVISPECIRAAALDVPQPSTAAIVSPRLCSRTACAGDVADFVRDADEMGATRGGPCISCGHRDGDWCVRLSRPCSDVCHGCYAHSPKGGAR